MEKCMKMTHGERCTRSVLLKNRSAGQMGEERATAKRRKGDGEKGRKGEWVEAHDSCDLI